LGNAKKGQGKEKQNKKKNPTNQPENKTNKTTQKKTQHPTTTPQTGSQKTSLVNSAGNDRSYQTAASTVMVRQKLVAESEKLEEDDQGTRQRKLPRKVHGKGPRGEDERVNDKMQK